jgi:hypothetical protein
MTGILMIKSTTAICPSFVFKFCPSHNDLISRKTSDYLLQIPNSLTFSINNGINIAGKTL